MQAWIDIENPPQVRYLLPCKRLLEERGHEVFLTARDDGSTFALLESEHADFVPVGRQAAGGKIAKAVGVLRRAGQLSRLMRSRGRCDLLLSASRPAVLAARRRGIVSFYVGDYEFADTTVQRRMGSYLVFPDVIGPETFLAQGFRADRLLPFPGLKEHISFAGVELEQIAAHRFAGVEDDCAILLFRPPGERSHYHRDQSTELTYELLRYLARDDRIRVVFSPRYRSQVQMLDGYAWARPPIVLDRPVNFVALLKSVDLVVSSGGTMVREAAFLGVPAYSIYRGRIGAVDRHLRAIGRLRFVQFGDEFGSLQPVKRVGLTPLATTPDVARAVLDRIVTLAGHSEA
jgi:uncharacterized protein